jgi:LPS export ABC transporter protein LptC
LLAALVVLGCEHRSAPARPVPGPDRADEPDQESWDVQFLISEGEAPRVRILAAYMANYERPDSTYMLLTGLTEADSVTVYLFDAAGDSSATLHADQVIYFDQDGYFDARGDVVVVSKEGSRLESEHLIWEEESRKIYTPNFVQMTTADERLQGYGLEADENLENYSLQRVTATFTMEDQ